MVRVLALAVVVASLTAPGASAARLKGDGPNMIATGYGSVWVGSGDNSVIRIDPRAHRIAQRIKVYGFVHGLVPAYGSLWVASGTAVLQRIDAVTGRVREIWSRDLWEVDSVAVAAGAIWVLDGAHDRLCRIDPRRNRIVRRVPVGGGEPLYVWSDGSRLWLAVNVEPKPPMVDDHLEHVRVIALGPADGLPLGPAIETAGWVRFSAGFGSLWSTNQIARTLTRIDPSSGRQLAARSGMWSIDAPVAGFGSLWLPDGGTLRRVDPDSMATVAEVDVRGSTVAVGSRAVWVLGTGDGTRGTVTKVDPRTNRTAGRPIPIVP
jgi:DNA-binding beta-propeller fold protein YncE